MVLLLSQPFRQQHAAPPGSTHIRVTALAADGSELAAAQTHTLIMAPEVLQQGSGRRAVDIAADAAVWPDNWFCERSTECQSSSRGAVP